MSAGAHPPPGAAADARRLALGTLLASFAGDAVPSWVWRAVDGGLGGICLYGSNRGADVGAVAAALHDVRADVVVALDEEGGDVTRLEATTGSSVPGNAALGGVDDVTLTRSVGAALGAVLHGVGVDLDLAPCADVNSDPSNPVIGVRSFGAGAALVSRHTAAFVGGLQSEGVAACVKHFPGHGAVSVDSHVALPTASAPGDLLRDRELAPFRAAIDAGVAAVMPGHLLVPALDADVPATVSHPIVTGILRGELGFRGLVVSDALDMGGIGGPAEIPANVVRALAAGTDLCCLGPDSDEALVEACVAAVVEAVDAGALAIERLADAATRVAGLRSALAPSGATDAGAADAGAVPAAVPAAQDAAGRPNPPQEPPQEIHGRSEASPGTSARSPGSPDTSAGSPGLPGTSARSPRLPGTSARSPGSPGTPARSPRSTWDALTAVGGEAARRALRVDGRLPGSVRGAHVVELDRPANIAAGTVPWGVAGPLAALDPTTSTTRVAEGDDSAVAHALVAAVDRPLVVVVRDPQRRPGQAAALQTLLGARPDAVVVDMGWPTSPTDPTDPTDRAGTADPADRPGPAAARITTYGASRASGEAVAGLLAGVPTTRGNTSTTTTEGRTSRG